MITDDELLNLPEQPELAFVEFENRCRERFYAEIGPGEGYHYAACQREYMNHILSFSRALDLDVLSNWELPCVGLDIAGYFESFVYEVDSYTMSVRVKNARRIRKYSVALDPVSKSKIRHHLLQIKETVDRLDVSHRKKETLYSKISALELEIARDRTRFEAAAAFILEASAIAGEAADKLEPVRKLVETISVILGRAKSYEDANAPALPAPQERRRIEPPTRQSTPSKPVELDDEVPF